MPLIIIIVCRENIDLHEISPIDMGTDSKRLTYLLLESKLSAKF